MTRGHRPRGYLLLAADDAGATDAAPLHAALAVLAADAPAQLRTTTDEQDLHAALDGLDGRRLVVAGGDGTLHLIVRALRARGAATSTPAGLVPLGTGNDLAHGLGLPLDPAAAARRVVHGEERALDVVVRDDEVAVNAAHAGFGVAAGQRARRLKPLFGAVAYRLAAVWAGAAEAGAGATVEVDGRMLVDARPVLLVAVMNGPSIGGGTPLCPPADPADGLLDVVVVVDRGRARRLAFAAALRRGRHLDLPGVAHRRGRHVGVRIADGSWNVDGEMTHGPAAVEWRVEPAAWRLVG